MLEGDVLKGIRPLIAGLGKRSNMDRAWFELAGSRLTRDDLDAGQEDGMFSPCEHDERWEEMLG